MIREGRYKKWIVSLLMLLLLSGCSLVDAVNPFSGKPSGPKMAELQPITATHAVESLWQGQIGSSDRYVFKPLVIGNSVYAASYDGTVARFDDGREIWRVAADARLSGGVGGDGARIVVGSNKGDVFAFSTQDGSLLWRTKVSSEIQAPAAVDSSWVIVKSGDNRLFSFNASNGERKWVYQRPTPVLSLRATGQPILSQNYVFSGFPGGKLVAVDLESGSAVWEGTVSLPKGATELDRISDIVSAPVIDGTMICAVAFQGRIACYDLMNGTQLWTREISSSAGLTIDNHSVYVTDDKGAVHALDRESGTSLWKQDKLFLRSVSAPLARQAWVAVGDISGTIHFLNREDGSFIARATTDGKPVQAPMQHYGSGLVLQTQRGGLFALQIK